MSDVPYKYKVGAPEYNADVYFVDIRSSCTICSVSDVFENTTWTYDITNPSTTHI
jgi:hypothetical protein